MGEHYGWPSSCWTWTTSSRSTTAWARHGGPRPAPGGRLLPALLREVDLCVRWGGDEFLILCRALDRQGVLEVANRLLEEIALLRIAGPGLPAIAITPSVGFVAYPFRRQQLLHSSQWSLLVQIADRYLYLAKERERPEPAASCSIPRGVREPEEELVRRVLAAPGEPPPGLEFHEVIFPLRRMCPGSGDLGGPACYNAVMIASQFPFCSC